MVPATRYGHVIATLEIFTGMLFTATMTGLVFVRFSKPKAKIVFADRPVVNARHGTWPMLMIRIGNGRLNALADAEARLTVLRLETGPDGRPYRRAVDAKLGRPDLPFFPLTWTLMHEIDESSPLHGLFADPVMLASARMMLGIAARDPSLGAQVYASRAYQASDVALGMRYADAVDWDGHDRSVADLRRISDLEPDPAWPAGSAEYPAPP